MYNTPLSPDRLLTPREVGERLGFHEEAVRRWVRDGHLPAVRIGGRIRISPATLAAFTRPSERPDGPKPGPKPGTRPNQTPPTDAITDHIAKVVAAAPPLTDDQIARITTILHASRGTAPALSRTA